MCTRACPIYVSRERLGKLCLGCMCVVRAPLAMRAHVRALFQYLWNDWTDCIAIWGVFTTESLCLPHNTMSGIHLQIRTCAPILYVSLERVDTCAESCSAAHYPSPRSLVHRRLRRLTDC